MRNARTSLLQRLHYLLGLAAREEPDSPDPAGKISRRQFLKGSAAVVIAASFPNTDAAAASSFRYDPRITIVGAGLAGLTAAHYLKRSGFSASIFEASSRSGGRMFSVKDAMAPGLVTEFGGEFIDSSHKDILALIEEYKLTLEDRAPAYETYTHRAFYFDNRFYSEAEVVEALKPIAQKIKQDAQKAFNAEITFEGASDAAKSFDRMALSNYFSSLGLPHWLESLFTIAYVGEYGLDTREQSTLNFLSLFPAPEVVHDFELYGQSDERFKIKGGNESLPNAIAASLGTIRFSHTLRSVSKTGQTYQLQFDTKDGAISNECDILLLALPFSILRKIPLNFDLPDWKKKAIKELGYGTNTKVMMGFSSRPWREKGYLGETYSDERFGLAWDNAETQDGTAGGLTVFLGGHEGAMADILAIDQLTAGYIESLEKIYPGITASQNHNERRMHWPSYKYAHGSYSAYKVGQWTTIRGAEMRPVGSLFFAGEHCSAESQGFMNGAAETGRVAAESMVSYITER